MTASIAHMKPMAMIAHTPKPSMKLSK